MSLAPVHADSAAEPFGPAVPDADADTMTALACTPFGAPGTTALWTWPIPRPGPGQLLVRVLSAGLGHWDLLEREGRLAPPGARVAPADIGGAEGAGTVVEVSRGVSRFREGDRVCGLVPLRRPKAGFHAQFVVLDAGCAWPVPGRLPMAQAAALPVDGGLAMHAVDVALQVRPDSTLLVFGASGGIGHMALQFARMRGARVLAVASGADGVALADALGADMAVDGRRCDVAAALRIFAPAGLDAALLTADAGPAGAAIVAALRPGGRLAWPHGVTPARSTAPRPDVAVTAFGAGAGASRVQAACRAAERGPFRVHLGTRVPLARIDEAERALGEHHLGRIVLDVP